MKYHIYEINNKKVEAHKKLNNETLVRVTVVVLEFALINGKNEQVSLKKDF